MAANLFTPILNDRTRSVHFFNGRLLTSEDLTSEQRGQRAMHELLGESIGDGIVRGLEVTIDDSNTVATPVVRVTGGLAINRQGDPLLLAASTRVQLVRSADAQPSTPSIFSACTPPESGVYVAGAGVYLLTLCTTVVGDGSAPVSGLGGQPAGCNSRYEVDAVQFRLIELPLSDDDFAHPNLLRNRVAYRCFGVDVLPSFATDPFNTAESTTLLDQLRPRKLTDCDVPLATLYWTASGGVVWLDMWSVRRRVAERWDEAVPTIIERKLRTNAEAILLQFQAQIAEMAKATSAPTLVARNVFDHLPPFGLLPLKVGASEYGFDYHHFFQGRTYRQPIFVNAAKLRPIAENFLLTTPIDMVQNEMVWLYRIVQNSMERNKPGATGPQQYLLFASGQIPYQGDAQFNVSYWNYSNYS
jgi:hypothetical protein